MGFGNFFPTVYMKRLQYHYLHEALLIMDGFGAHETFTFTEHCKINKINVIYLIPHSSHMTQPLDLVSFGSLKAGFISIKIGKGENPQTNKIIKMMRAWACSTTADLNVAAFAAAGFVTYLNKNANQVYLRIDLTKSTYLVRLADQVTSDVTHLDIAAPSRTRIDSGKSSPKK
jgi:hypothetical protein